MRLLIYIFILCNLYVSIVYTQDNRPELILANVSPSLIQNSDGIYRLYDEKFEVIDPGNAIEETHYTVTILNSKGAKQFENIYLPYNKFNLIEDIDFKVYDKNGVLIRKLKKKDISDFKELEYFIDDTRFKRIEIPHSEFPYTVDFYVKYIRKSLLFYPRFTPQCSNNFSVEKSNFIVHTNPELQFRTKSINTDVKATIEGNIHKWTFGNIPSKKNNSNSSSDKQIKILTGTNKFTFDGYEGDMQSWESLGRFFYNLGEKRQELDVITQIKIKKLVEHCTDEMCKIKALYKYLQQNNRYFSIQLGIGGWQPLTAQFVEDNKYGDCKALSNYMNAMLKVVGIKGYNVVIMAGTENRDKIQYPDFPNPFFNHMISCVMTQNDTLFLECTSTTESCGFLSGFTSDRPALILTEKGGVLLNTPKYDAAVNTQKLLSKVEIEENGSAMARTTIYLKGILQDDIARIKSQPSSDLKIELLDQYKLNKATIDSISFVKDDEIIPTVTQTMHLKLGSLASKSGKRLFLTPNVFSRFDEVPLRDSLRYADVQADAFGFTEIDTINYTIPSGFVMETKAYNSSHSSFFGSYEAAFTEIENGKYQYTRQFILNDKVAPASQYPELVTFLANVAKEDRTKIVLVKAAESINSKP
jgi:hypothetical protein